jgi:hypothetical protein
MVEVSSFSGQFGSETFLLAVSIGRNGGLDFVGKKWTLAFKTSL